MPNWCSNTVEIRGSEEAVAAFVMAAKGSHACYNGCAAFGSSPWPAHDEVRLRALTRVPAELASAVQEFCFNALYPVPEDFRRFPYDDEQARKVGDAVGEERAYGGYRWQSDHWGTKWDVSDIYIDYGPASFILLEFSTAWGPPISFFEKVCGDFPELTFELTFHEGGMGFAGKCTFDHGELIEEEELPIEDFVEDEDEDMDGEKIVYAQDEQPLTEYMSLLEKQDG